MFAAVYLGMCDVTVEKGRVNVDSMLCDVQPSLHLSLLFSLCFM